MDLLQTIDFLVYLLYSLFDSMLHNSFTANRSKWSFNHSSLLQTPPVYRRLVSADECSWFRDELMKLCREEFDADDELLASVQSSPHFIHMLRYHDMALFYLIT